MLKKSTGATRIRSLSAWCMGLAILGAGASASAAIIDETGEAEATLASTKGSAAVGLATFKSAGKDGVQITVEATGLKPGSLHGIHVHEKGDCSAPDASSAGPHFSIPGQQHGSRDGASSHAGDLGNLTANAQGKARASLVVPDSKLTLAPGPLSVVGRAVVVHAAPDDLKSQPSGESGARIACGVVARRTTNDGKKPLKPAAK